MCLRKFHLFTYSNHEAFVRATVNVFEDEKYSPTSGPSGMVLAITKYNDEKIKEERNNYPYDELLQFAQEGKVEVNEMPFHDWKSFRAVVEFLKKRGIIDVFGVIQIEVG